MLTSLLALAVGLAILVWSADRFIDASAAMAHHWGLPPLFIGVVIVGFGTSAPEMTVSVLAAMDGMPNLALGNALGSNIANVCLILGITALLHPIEVHSSILRKEIPLLILTSLGLGGLMLDGRLSGLDGGWLLVVFAALLTWTAVQANRASPNPAEPLDPFVQEADTLSAEADAHMSTRQAWLWLVLGLLLLIGSSRLMVWGAVNIAQSLGVSELVIGLTIVAVGTSLPELAACITAARKGQNELAMGNVLGSNLFNLMGVVGLATLVRPFDVEALVLWRDMPWIVGTTALLWLLSWSRHQQVGVLSRPAGSALMALYAAYTVHLFVTAI